MEYELFSVGGASPFDTNIGCDNGCHNTCTDNNCTDNECTGNHCHVGGEDEDKYCGADNKYCGIGNSRCGTGDVINGIGNTTF